MAETGETPTWETVAHASERIGISTRTIKKWVSAGHLSRNMFHDDSGREKLIICVQQLDDFLAGKNFTLLRDLSYDYAFFQGFGWDRTKIIEHLAAGYQLDKKDVGRWIHRDGTANFRFLRTTQKSNASTKDASGWGSTSPRAGDSDSVNSTCAPGGGSEIAHIEIDEALAEKRREEGKGYQALCDENARLVREKKRLEDDIRDARLLLPCIGGGVNATQSE